MLAREVRDALASLEVHPDVAAVVEEVAGRRGLTLDRPGDGSLVVRSAAGTAQVAATVHPSQLFLLVDPALVRQVRDDIGWSITRRSAGAHHVTIRAEDLLGPAAQELAVSLLERAVVAAASAAPPAVPAPRRTAAGRSSGPSTPRVRKATVAKPVLPEPPAAEVCPTCFQEKLGGECANCE